MPEGLLDLKGIIPLLWVKERHPTEHGDRTKPDQSELECLDWVLVVWKRKRLTDGWQYVGAALVRCWLCPHRRHERPNAHHVHDTGEIIGKHV